MLKCACCEQFTVEEEYDICSVCGWERDHVQERFIGMRGGANRMCLAEARENYRDTGRAENDGER